MTKEESDLIISEQNKSREEILKAVAKVKADYHELCNLKDMRIANLEKENAELEQENALLKGRNEGFEKQIMGLLIKYEEFYKRFPDLKNAMDKAEEVLKENARLKLELEALSGDIPWKDIKDKSEVLGKLTKARELLKGIVDTPMYYQMGGEAYESEEYKELIAEAENFLKE